MIEDSKWGPHSIGIFFYADGSYILHTLVNICKSHVYVNRYQGLWARHWIGIPRITPQPTLSINDKKNNQESQNRSSNKNWDPICQARIAEINPRTKTGCEDFRKKQSQSGSVINCNNITKAGVKREKSRCREIVEVLINYAKGTIRSWKAEGGCRGLNLKMCPVQGSEANCRKIP